jgi:hypothetical protein
MISVVTSVPRGQVFETEERLEYGHDVMSAVAGVTAVSSSKLTQSALR